MPCPAPADRCRCRRRSGLPSPSLPAAAAVLLTLCDDATPLWLDRPLRDDASGLEAWLRFHTGAPSTDDPSTADFAIVSSPSALPDLADFAVGTDEAPHTSTTVIVIDRDQAPGRVYRASGPGFERPSRWTAPVFPASFHTQWVENGARFPRGVDLVIVGRDSVTGLPRTTRLQEEN